jgi:hypothetical protein
MEIARAVVMLLSEPKDRILPVLDSWAELIRRTNRAFPSPRTP